MIAHSNTILASPSHLQYGVAVDSSALPALRFVCSLMRPQDKLVLMRVVPKDEGLGETSAHQRLITSFKARKMLASLLPSPALSLSHSVSRYPNPTAPNAAIDPFFPPLCSGLAAHT